MFVLKNSTKKILNDQEKINPKAYLDSKPTPERNKKNSMKLSERVENIEISLCLKLKI